MATSILFNEERRFSIQSSWASWIILKNLPSFHRGKGGINQAGFANDRAVEVTSFSGLLVDFAHQNKVK